MNTNVAQHLRRLAKAVWVRAAAFSMAAIGTALLAGFVGPYIPYDPGLTLASGSVDDILGILATSMLTVTTFSLSVMVAAYSSATSNVTPRATRLLREDPVAQNTLATFVGAFLFSIVGIIGISAGVYNGKGRVILFAATLIVLVMITVMLLRWIEQIGRLGRVSDTIHRIEAAALPVAKQWGSCPRLGARAAVAVPDGARAIFGGNAGFVGHIDVDELVKLADRHDLIVHLAVLPGAFVHPARPLAHVTPAVDDSLVRMIADCVLIEPERSYDHDLRFGLIVLSEVASRALSPAVNDPGTAIEVLGAGLRVLLAYSRGLRGAEPAIHARLYAPDLTTGDLFNDFFNPIARDGSSLVEVQMLIQAVLEALAANDPGLFGTDARAHAKSALARAQDALAADEDRERLGDAAAWIGRVN